MEKGSDSNEIKKKTDHWFGKDKCFQHTVHWSECKTIAHMAAGKARKSDVICGKFPGTLFRFRNHP